MPGVVVGVGHAGDVQTAGGESHLVRQSLNPSLQVVENVDIVVHHQSVIKVEVEVTRDEVEIYLS